MFGSTSGLTSHRIISFEQSERPLGTQMHATYEYHAWASCIASLMWENNIGKYADARLSFFYTIFLEHTLASECLVQILIISRKGPSKNMFHKISFIWIWSSEMNVINFDDLAYWNKYGISVSI